MNSCRIERGAELAAEIRAELVEGRKKLKELQEAEKESRRRKRAAALALATVSAIGVDTTWLTVLTHCVLLLQRSVRT